MPTYAEYSRRLWTSVRHHHLPIAGAIELTYRCNFSCGHCYLQDCRDQPELDGAAWMRIVDEIAQAGCLWLTLTGGEPLLHPEFPSIYRHAVRRGLLVTVFSNGSLLNSEAISLFTLLPPRTIEVTLYGSSPETYRALTGSAAHFEQALAGVQRAVAAGLDVHLKTMVLRETAGDLDELRRMANQMGIPFRFDGVVHATLQGSMAPVSYRLDPEDIVAVEQQDAATQEGLARRAASSQQDLGCGAGRFAFNISPDGFLQPCTLVRGLRWDLSGQAFADAWTTMRQVVGNGAMESASKCAGCEARPFCSSCPGMVALERGDMRSTVETFCKTARLRAVRPSAHPMEDALSSGIKG